MVGRFAGANKSLAPQLKYANRFDPNPVHAELVEELSFSSRLTPNCLKKKQSFDKLRMDGFGSGI